MNDTIAWPTLVFLGLSIALLSVPYLFRFIDAAPVIHQHRLDALDGLRGILASAVFLNYYFITTYGAKSGVSNTPPIKFYAFLGPADVIH